MKDTVEVPRPAVEDAAIADADAISDEDEGDGTGVVDVDDRRILALCSNPPATATTSAVVTPADANGIPEGGGGGPDGSDWVVGLSEAVNDDPAEAVEDEDGVIGVVCLSFVICQHLTVICSIVLMSAVVVLCSLSVTDL